MPLQQKNQSEITLIDPFQLVDYKTKIIPDHLYPKFRLILDKFKTQNNNAPEIPILVENEADITQEETVEQTTGNERISKAMETSTPTETDTTIRKMMQNKKPEKIIFPTDLRDIRKPKSYNKKRENNKKPASEYKEPTIVLKQIEYIPPNLDQPEEEYTTPSQVQPEKITKQNKRKGTPTTEFEEI